MPRVLNLNEILEKMNIEKELLSTMPQNNEKNKNKYQEKVKELIKEYSKYKRDIVEILENRYNEKINIAENSELNNLQERIKTIDSILYLFNENKNSYEKMALDRNIYSINKFYKENFENINMQILECINKFNDVGIKLEGEDFNYTIYVKEYMQVFLEEMSNLNADKLKERFEVLYWKCPDLIIHIVANIRNLYFKYQQQIGKYLEQEKEQLLEKWGKKPRDIMNAYLELKIKRDEILKTDKSIIINEFIKGKRNIKDYDSNKILKDLQDIYDKDKIGNFEDSKTIDEMENKISKFLNSLYEYKNYLEFKFIVDDIKKYYKDRAQYKKDYDETKKKIDTIEKKVASISKRVEKVGLFGKKRDNTKELVEQNNLILELKEKYKELDLNEFYTKINNKLQDNSTIFDVLNLASSSYYYLLTTIIKNQEDIEPAEIEAKIERLKDFLKSPYNNIINNITILEERNVALIVKDRYKLSNFKLEKADLDADNVENLISILEKIKKYLNMKESGIIVKDIEELLEIKKLLK